MTAPAVTNAPVTDGITTDSPFAIDNEIASITQAAVQQTLAESPDAVETDQPRRPDGTFAPKPKTDPAPALTDAPVAAPDGTTTAPDETTPLALPEGFVAALPVKGRPLATTFTVRDHDGELEVPDVTIEFTANGKARNESLDKVVRLAERGVYNEEREQAVVQQRQEAQAVVQEYQRLAAYTRQLEAERDRVLSSDDAYLEERAKWEAQRTPEAQLERERAERQSMEQRTAYMHAAQVSNEFFTGTVMPAVEKISAVLPTVTQDEIGARLVLLTNHLRVPTPDGDTIIPPRAHDQVRQIVLKEIAPWALQLHEARDASTKAEREAVTQRQREADARTSQAQIDAQKAKNLLGKNARRGPATANTGTATRETEPKKPIKDIDDAMSSALDATMAAMGMSRSGGS